MADQPSALRELSLFAGAGGGILGGALLGWRTVCAVEIEPYAAGVLVARQNDGTLPPFPIWDDVRTFAPGPWRDRVDVVSGGFPCQDISAAGRGAGIEGERSGLWREMLRIVRGVRPRFVFMENSPLLTRRGLSTVLGELAALRYDAAWGVFGACDAGAPHKRDRIWILASDTDGVNRRSGTGRKNREKACDGIANVARLGRTERRTELEGKQGGFTITGGSCAPANVACKGLAQRQTVSGEQFQAFTRGDWWAVEPDVVRMVHGLPDRVDRIKALGNAQVPSVAALAWSELTKQLGITCN